MKTKYSVCLIFFILTNAVGISQAGKLSWHELDPDRLKLRSKYALVLDSQGNEIFSRNAETAVPIASITKLMTALVTLDSGLPLDEMIVITKSDRDLVRQTGSRLKYGANLSRRELIRLALMASENRAAAALGRSYPGGTPGFVTRMNSMAVEIGMKNTHFADPAGLDAANRASAKDLSILVKAAAKQPLIKEATTMRTHTVYPYKKRGPLKYGNTNRLLKNKNWNIKLSKTGYINEAGRCLVMLTELQKEPLTIILLNSFGKLTPFGDANRLRKWLKQGHPVQAAEVKQSPERLAAKKAKDMTQTGS